MYFIVINNQFIENMCFRTINSIADKIAMTRNIYTYLFKPADKQTEITSYYLV